MSSIATTLLVRERATLRVAAAVDLASDDAAATPAIDIETMAAPAIRGAQRVAVRLTDFADLGDFGCSRTWFRLLNVGSAPGCPVACHDVGKARRYASADWSENSWPDGQDGLW